ncbi:methyltransferase domain-containing protein [Bacillus mangrovi]|uniref:Methyltransferase domain-containing protein n=1 Tax=Metabacillus mangrovi TaxID=1491830 RepID=A0A7X2S649_9BACI|nr:class I SAM-dependent methyltransferase [Metabacillus mangrovi]MTH53951.1 methyltransferase domain-containing protein [Metabacillus mangrovi]
MLNDYVRIMKARGWMKKNIPFLYTWHAYVGYELDLYEYFRKPKTISEVAQAYDLKLDLLERWMEVGLAIKYMKKMPKGRFRTSRSFMLPSGKKNPRSTGVILKEMMELHIPALLSYPAIMTTENKQTFDHDMHGGVVAQTSSLLEQAAYPVMHQIVKKKGAESVLDVGCGHAGYLIRLAKDFPHLKLTGIELNEGVANEARLRCRDYPELNIECRDAFEWNYAEKKDLVLINNLLHYIPHEKRPDLLKRASSWLGEAGEIIILTPMKHEKYGRQFSSVFNSFFSAFSNLHPIPGEGDVKEIAEQAGLHVSSIRPVIKEGGWFAVRLVK